MIIYKTPRDGERTVKLRQWAIEQSIKSGAQTEAVRYYADRFLEYVLPLKDEASE